MNQNGIYHMKLWGARLWIASIVIAAFANRRALSVLAFQAPIRRQPTRAKPFRVTAQ